MNRLVDAAVHMVRLGMDDLPLCPLPAGYRFRSYRMGDEESWVALHQDAEPWFRVERAHFEQSFGGERASLVDRMFFVQAPTGEDVGTITAWWQDDWKGRGGWGQIHWLVVATAHQRRGLAKAMVAHALRRIACDQTRAMLGTNTQRLWAIKCYLDFGFVPDPAERAAVEAERGWQALSQQLPHPAVERWLSSLDRL
jgi:GNAT superfamily N-acetyltransferase